MNTSTGAFFIIVGRRGTGDERSLRLSGAEILGLAWTLGIGDVASLGVLGMGMFALLGGVAGSDGGGVDSPCIGVDLVAPDGLVNALSLFSLSSFVRTPDLGVSMGSTRFLLGAKTGAGLTVGSMGVRTAAFRRSSMIMLGTKGIVLLVGSDLEFISLGVQIPGRFAGWKWAIAFASFRNRSSLLLLALTLTGTSASGSFILHPRFLSTGGIVPLSFISGILARLMTGPLLFMPSGTFTPFSSTSLSLRSA